MYNRVLGHLNNDNVWVEEHCRFRKNLTTEEATHELINELLSAVIDKLIVRGVCCDLAETFDCVNQDILLLKLNFYGITGTANEWIISYLSDRYQRVK
jgi:hypothetical protein